MIMMKNIRKSNLIQDEELILYKTIEIPTITVVFRAIFYENN